MYLSSFLPRLHNNMDGLCALKPKFAHTLCRFEPKANTLCAKKAHLCKLLNLLKYSLEAVCVTSKYIAGTSIQSSQQDIWSSQGIKALPRCKTPLSTCPSTYPKHIETSEGILDLSSACMVGSVVYGRHVRACELPTYGGPFSRTHSAPRHCAVHCNFGWSWSSH